MQILKTVDRYLPYGVEGFTRDAPFLGMSAAASLRPPRLHPSCSQYGVQSTKLTRGRYSFTLYHNKTEGVCQHIRSSLAEPAGSVPLAQQYPSVNIWTSGCFHAPCSSPTIPHLALPFHERNLGAIVKPIDAIELLEQFLVERPLRTDPKAFASRNLSSLFIHLGPKAHLDLGYHCRSFCFVLIRNTTSLNGYK
jgi:hypothetical protein